MSIHLARRHSDLKEPSEITGKMRAPKKPTQITPSEKGKLYVVFFFYYY